MTDTTQPTIHPDKYGAVVMFPGREYPVAILSTFRVERDERTWDTFMETLAIGPRILVFRDDSDINGVYVDCAPSAMVQAF